MLAQKYIDAQRTLFPTYIRLLRGGNFVEKAAVDKLEQNKPTLILHGEQPPSKIIAPGLGGTAHREHNAIFLDMEEIDKSAWLIHRRPELGLFDDAEISRASFMLRYFHELSHLAIHWQQDKFAATVMKFEENVPLVLFAGAKNESLTFYLTKFIVESPDMPNRKVISELDKAMWERLRDIVRDATRPIDVFDSSVVERIKLELEIMPHMDALNLSYTPHTLRLALKNPLIERVTNQEKKLYRDNMELAAEVEGNPELRKAAEELAKTVFR